MGFYATVCTKEQTHLPLKNRVGGFSSYSETRTGFFVTQPLESHRETEPTPTTIASGMRYYGFRYYSPNLGRWVSRDPMEEDGGENIYGFIFNDPISSADFLGLECVCGPDVTEWFRKEVRAHVTRARSYGTALFAPTKFKDQAAYDMGYKWMNFSAEGCGTGPCKHTVALAGTCIRKNQLGNIMFMVVASSMRLQTFGFWKYNATTPEGVARYASEDPKISTYWDRHPHARNYGHLKGQQRRDNLAAWGVGSALGSDWKSATKTTESFEKTVSQLMDSALVVNKFNGLANKDVSVSDLSFVPEYGGFDTRTCKTTCSQKYVGPSSFQARIERKKRFDSEQLSDLDAWQREQYEDYFNPNWQTECK